RTCIPSSMPALMRSPRVIGATNSAWNSSRRCSAPECPSTYSDGRPTSLVEPTEPFARDLVARQGGACCFRSSLPRSYPTRARSGNPRVRSPFCGTVTNRVESSYRTHGERRATLRHRALLAARTCSEPFGVFYERHFASVLGFFRRRVRGPEEAFDLAA